MFFHSPAWEEVEYWALDLETSGLKPREDCILSAAVVPVRGGVIRYGERYYSLVRPPDPARLSTEGIRAHHILPGELAEAPALPVVVSELDRRIQDRVLVLHYASLDLGFMRAAYEAAGLGWGRPRVIDTVDLLLKLHQRRQRFTPYPTPIRTALPEARAGLGLPAYVNHHAICDALATAELFLVLRARLGARRLRDLT
jgi:DNA polymerase III subunit epsilon